MQPYTCNPTGLQPYRDATLRRDASGGMHWRAPLATMQTSTATLHLHPCKWIPASGVLQVEGCKSTCNPPLASPPLATPPLANSPLASLHLQPSTCNPPLAIPPLASKSTCNFHLQLPLATLHLQPEALASLEACKWTSMLAYLCLHTSACIPLLAYLCLQPSAIATL